MNLYKNIEKELETRCSSKVYNDIKILESPQGATVVIDNKEYLNMCSNNYLGFANEEFVKNAAKSAIDTYGIGLGAVRSISGSYNLHLEFEKKLAKFKGVEDVIVVQSGFQANTTLLPSITTAEDIVLSDELNHASIIDAIRLSKASVKVYRHCDLDDLEEKLKECQDIKGNLFIISDGVFSMDGDYAPLDKIYELSQRYNAYTIVDDAHGEGVLGENGRGIVSEFGLENKIDIEIGTLSKAFGISGGFIGGRKILIDYLKQVARPFLFSTGLDISNCGAGIAVVDNMEIDNSRVTKLWANAKYLQEKLLSLGYDIGDTQTPITPLIVGDEKLATELTQKLYEKQILVSPIMYPTVAKGKARIRLMVSSVHSTEQIDYLIAEISSILSL